jgi:hypothetical protein
VPVLPLGEMVQNCPARGHADPRPRQGCWPTLLLAAAAAAVVVVATTAVATAAVGFLAALLVAARLVGALGAADVCLPLEEEDRQPEAP